jgi:hypothetical protein
MTLACHGSTLGAHEVGPARRLAAFVMLGDFIVPGRYRLSPRKLLAGHIAPYGWFARPDMSAHMIFPAKFEKNCGRNQTRHARPDDC